MAKSATTRIFARHGTSGFVGRAVHVERLIKQARGGDKANGLVMLAAPSVGSSELVRHTYDRLFNEQDEVIPFYFEIKPTDRTAQNTALRFLCEFLLQTVAFRRGDPSIISASPAMSEIEELAAPADGYWIDRLVAASHGESVISGERSFVRNCLSAPLRAAANGALIYVMIDGVHSAAEVDGGDALVGDLADIFASSPVPFVFAGHRRFLYSRMPFETMNVEPFSFAEAGQYIEKLCGEKHVKINDQTRDLIAVQLGGNAAYINSLIASAADAECDLDSFDHVERIYTDEIFGGRICKNLDALFDLILPSAEFQQNTLRLLAESNSSPDGTLPVEYWKKQFGAGPAEFEHALGSMHNHEIVNAGSGRVKVDRSNLVLLDYINARVRLEVAKDTRALAVGEALSANIKRAPALMARYYRQTAAIGLRELMSSFDGREISPALIDYARFRDTFKGQPDDEVLEALNKDPEKATLPHIVYTAHSAAFYPKLNEICDAERSAVALGFANSAEKDEVVWIAAEIESKLEATAKIAEFWCDRLEMIALSCNFRRYRLWLVAPAGFDADALSVLNSRNAHGSSRKQIDLMIAVLGPKLPLSVEIKPNEYEIVVPMGEDTEMIAAHAVEEIAKRFHFPAKAITQIKTALVEACINAAEHSLSPDRKIYQKFSVDNDKLVITIANRGLRLADKEAREVTPDKGRRGWGLKLMKGLMDDVKIEQTDDGTRITMVKYLQHAT